jgi:hypothetical protein
MDGFHVEGMAKDKRQPLLRTEISEPRPREDTFDGNDNIGAIGRDSLEKRLWASGHIPVQEDRTLLVQDAKVHGAGMQIDTTVKLVLFRIESHEVSSSLERDISHSQHTTGVC